MSLERTCGTIEAAPADAAVGGRSRRLITGAAVGTVAFVVARDQGWV